jgi:hypothetical protein
MIGLAPDITSVTAVRHGVLALTFADGTTDELKGLKATRSTSRPGTRRRTALTPSWSCSARPARSARPRRRLALELLFDLIDEVEVQLEQPVQEAGNDQQVLLAMR